MACYWGCRTPSNKAAYIFLFFFLAAAGALWGVGLSRLIPLVRALVECAQTEVAAQAVDPQWCVSPFLSLATVPLALTGAGLLAALAAFIILCFFCCCSVRPGIMARYGGGAEPQFLTGAAAEGGYYPGSPQQQMRIDPEAGGATYWDEKAGRLVPGPGPASARSGGAASSSSHHHQPPPPIVPVTAYAPPSASSPVGEPVGAAHDYPQVTPSV